MLDMRVGMNGNADKRRVSDWAECRMMQEMKDVVSRRLVAWFVGRGGH